MRRLTISCYDCPRMRPTLTALSLFSGAGGLDHGLGRSQWDILAHVEMNASAAETLRLNKADNVIQSPIEAVDPKALRSSLRLKKGELALLAGGPPCQPFTTTGLRKAISDRRASTLFPSYLRFVDAFEPQALLIENVDGMLSAALRHRPLAQRGPGFPSMATAEMKGSFLRWLLLELAGRGYSVCWGVAEAADYGVPQIRQRAILIGVRGDEPCFLPRPTFGRGNLPSYRSISSVIGDLGDLGPIQPLSDRKRSVYERIPAGGNWRDLPKVVQERTMGAAFRAEGGKSGWWRRLAWDSPAPTILGMPDHSSTALIHPDETRCLSVRECAALQTFPKNYRFGGTSRSQYQQIGNAVPPLLGEVLGRHIREFLDGKRTGVPEAAEWRRVSANRRIGTHGWVIPGRQPRFYITVKIRPDHVWALAAPNTLRVA